MTPDEAAKRVYVALQQQKYRLALDSVDEALSLSIDRPLLEARLMAWQAQALLGLNQLEQAQQAVLRGLRLARSAKDTGGVAALRSLHKEIVARLVVSQVPEDAADTLVSRSCIAFDQGLEAKGIDLAKTALEQADNPRDQVLALLALARSPNQAPTAILQAHRIAQDSDDFNLISAVAKAALAARVELPSHVF